VGAERQVPGAWGSLEVQMASEVKHVFTHQTWRISPWIVRGLAKERASTVARATGAAELGALGIGTAPSGGLPTLTRRLIEAVDAMAGDASPSAATVNARRRRGTIRPP
jgi:hypothetical protein